MLDDEQPDRVRARGYYHQDLSDQQWAQYKQNLNATIKPYYEAPLPTRYEHPDWYPAMMLAFDKVHGAMVRHNQGIEPPPLIATLPSGDINARSMQEPSSGRQIIFFEHGLFKYIEDFAWLVAWAVPEISPAQMMNDRQLARMNTRYQIPPQAFEHFTSVLGSYVLHGNAIWWNRRRELDPTNLHRQEEFSWGGGFVKADRSVYNLQLHFALGTIMEYFNMAHELKHLTLGHLAQTPSTARQSWESELEADVEGAGLATAIMNQHLGPRANALTFWACSLMLTAMNFLVRALALFAFGPSKFIWTSVTHPDPLTRRAHLWSAFSSSRDISRVSVAAAKHLGVMTDAIFQQLWERAIEDWYLIYQSGGRPSPLWNEAIRSQLAPATN